jgi:hypothetical protein
VDTDVARLRRILEDARLARQECGVEVTRGGDEQPIGRILQRRPWDVAGIDRRGR